MQGTKRIGVLTRTGIARPTPFRPPSCQQRLKVRQVAEALDRAPRDLRRGRDERPDYGQASMTNERIGGDISPELLERYRATIVDAVGLPPKKANRLVDENRSYFRMLRETAEGRQAIERFLDDEDVAVRLTAAAQTLAWDPARGEEVLEVIAAGDSNRAFEAKMTLKEFRVGRLDPNY